MTMPPTCVGNQACTCIHNLTCNSGILVFILALEKAYIKTKDQTTHNAVLAITSLAT